MIGYYVHHHGFGHLARAMSICTQMRRPVTVLSSRPIPEDHPFTAVVELPRDDTAERISEPTAHGALHWAPHHDAGYVARMNAIAQWIADVRPEAFVVDVSVEVATFVRLLGVPLVVMAQPGARNDPPHQLVHQMADRIVAAWPRELYAPAWLSHYRDKTAFVGGISRFEGRYPDGGGSQKGSGTKVLVLAGAEGMGIDPARLDASTAMLDDVSWTTLGAVGGDWVDDPWPQICAADIVVTHAGQNSIADVAAARRAAIVIPQSRPFGEQAAMGAVLDRSQLAIVTSRWPEPGEWPDLLSHAKSRPPQWQRWQVGGAARRAADAIEATARRYSGRAEE